MPIANYMDEGNDLVSIINFICGYNYKLSERQMKKEYQVLQQEIHLKKKNAPEAIFAYILKIAICSKKAVDFEILGILLSLTFI